MGVIPDILDMIPDKLGARPDQTRPDKTVMLFYLAFPPVRALYPTSCSPQAFRATLDGFAKLTLSGETNQAPAFIPLPYAIQRTHLS